VVAGLGGAVGRRAQDLRERVCRPGGPQPDRCQPASGGAGDCGGQVWPSFVAQHDRERPGGHTLGGGVAGQAGVGDGTVRADPGRLGAAGLVQRLGREVVASGQQRQVPFVAR
jgi:hypothetical protein